MNEKLGYCLAPNKKIRKVKIIFADYLEYTLLDVMDGDTIMFYHSSKASNMSDRFGGNPFPPLFHLIGKTLLLTHLILTLIQDPSDNIDGIITWSLKVTVMFINHICDPNAIDYHQFHDKVKSYASHNMKKGKT